MALIQRLCLLSLFFASFALNSAIADPRHAWKATPFKALVSFGDSYTDQSRYNYFNTHNSSMPPVGWKQPDSNNTASGGYIWGHYVAQAGVPLYNYAVGGAVCSNAITPLHDAATNGAFQHSNINTTEDERILDIPTNQTIYSLWIGTNDLGHHAFLTDSQVPNRTIPDYINCIYSVFDSLYANGARWFVLMNLTPLHLSPLYATPERNGVSRYSNWPDKPDNRTLISYRMWEQVAAVNDMFTYRTAYELLVAGRYPGARFVVMELDGLISDIYYHPEQYFNGTASPNVTGFNHHSDTQGSHCKRLPDPDSFLWSDELHPSQRTNKIIAESFLEVIRGEGKWATYW